jgi:heme-degrading monooxygenase HmoA
MIERIWSARTTRSGAASYAEYFRRAVLPELGAIAGYRGVRLLRREMPDGMAVEIVVVTVWDSLAAIRGFAGEEIERAVVHDEAAALLSDFDRTVRHYELVSW